MRSSSETYEKVAKRCSSYNPTRTGAKNIIDSKEEVYVTTTEELLQAVQYGKKPKFVGDCSIAVTVYNNAK